MRNVSFSKTTEQIRNRTKTVTRRDVNTWRDLKPGDVLQAVSKAQGLKKGDRIERLAVIRVVSVRDEILADITPEEVTREGFPGQPPWWFIMEVYKAHRLTPVRRIEFEYVE